MSMIEGEEGEAAVGVEEGTLKVVGLLVYVPWNHFLILELSAMLGTSSPWLLRILNPHS